MSAVLSLRCSVAAAAEDTMHGTMRASRCERRERKTASTHHMSHCNSFSAKFLFGRSCSWRSATKASACFLKQ
jgi:hypothetical protein